MQIEYCKERLARAYKIPFVKINKDKPWEIKYLHDFRNLMINSARTDLKIAEKRRQKRSEKKDLQKIREARKLRKKLAKL